jgi:hypothetical protein
MTEDISAQRLLRNWVRFFKSLLEHYLFVYGRLATPQTLAPAFPAANGAPE